MLLKFFCVEVESCDKKFFSREIVRSFASDFCSQKWQNFQERDSGLDGWRKVVIQERKDVGK